MAHHISDSKRVILLGARSDIGRSLLARLSGIPEMEILAVSRSPREDKQPTAAKIEWLDGIDLTEERSLIALSTTAANMFSEPFSVIHSVGNFWVHKPLVETSLSEISAMLGSHVLTLLGVARYLTPCMIRNGGGKIIAFSCNSVSYSYPDMSPLTAAKAAIESFVKCYSHEHSEFRISSCALALPTIRTETVLKEKQKGDHENYITPEELAEIIVEQVLPQPPEVTANVIKLLKYSPTFYNTGYYDRNPRRAS